jgi:hypothetical protein
MTASAATRIDSNRDWSFRVESGSIAPLLLAGAGTGISREKPQPFSLVVKLLRPDGSISMERSLTSQ